MRAAALLALFLAVSPVEAQYLERVIPFCADIADSGATSGPGELLVNPVTDELYILGCDGWLVVARCATNRIAKEMPVGIGADSRRTPLLLWSSSNQKVYCRTGSELVIIDGVADSIVARVPTGAVASMVFDDSNNCLVAAASDSHCLLCIDGASNEVRARLRTNARPELVAWNSKDNRYHVVMTAGNLCWMRVYDAATLEPLADVGSSGQSALAYVPAVDRVYVGGTTLEIVDGFLNRVTGRLPLAVTRLVWNSERNLLYCVGDSLWVLDCATNTVIRSVAVPPSHQWYGDYVASKDRVYLYGDGGAFLAVDCSADTFVLELDGYFLFAWHETRDCAYLAGNFVRVYRLDGGVGQFRDSLAVGFFTGAMTDALWNPAVGKLYVRSAGIPPDWKSSLLTVFDGATCRAVKRFRTGRYDAYRSRLCLDSSSLKLYCANGLDSTISVIDCLGDSVLAQIRTPPYPFHLALNATDNKLYCTHFYSSPQAKLTVLDCSGDSVLRVVALPDLASHFVVWHRGVDKAYVQNHGNGTISVVDGKTDQLLGTVAGVRCPYVQPATCDLTDDKLCVTSVDLFGRPGFYLVDARGDTVIDSFPQVTCCGGVVWNENSDKAFFAGIPTYPPPRGPYAVSIVDCARDSFLTTLSGLSPPGQQAGPVSHPTRGRVYFGLEDAGVAVLDCDRDSVARVVGFPVTDCLSSLSLDVEGNRVFAVGASRIYVIRDPPSALENSTVVAGTQLPGLVSWPIPARRGVAVRAAVPVALGTRLAIYSQDGRCVRLLRSQTQVRQPDWTWDLRDQAGNLVPAGTYFAVVRSKEKATSLKLCVVR